MQEILIRNATLEDAENIHNIYRYYVENTTITFETEVPTVEEIRSRIEQTLISYPYLVAEYENQFIGYTYAGPFRKRKAYSSSAEISLYLDNEIRGKGFGRALLSNLEIQLREKGIHTMVSVIESSNTGSLRFHEKNGFINAGYLPRIGYKFDKWLDIQILTKQIMY